MSTATLTREARRNVALFSQTFTGGQSFKMYRKTLEHSAEKGGGKYEVLVIENMPVFRAGTFRDSSGYQHTWEDVHMQHMVEHFDLLASRGVLEHVPIRKGHPGFFTSGAEIQDSLIGYHTALRTERMVNPVDGQEYNYLLADYEILDPDAMVKVERGLWRNMSAEVGTWFTNDEAEFWPVYQGVAYVDFSAVEGLKNYSSANGVGDKYSIMIDKELSVGTETASTVQVPAPPAGVPVPPVLTPPAPPAAAPVAPVAQHAAPAQTFEFTLPNGTKTADFAAVQAELTSLADFKKESIESGRKMFAAQLAKDNKITAADVPGVEKFALSLTDEQFTAYTKQWETVAVNPALGVHADGTSNHSGQTPVGGGQVSAADQAIIDAQDTIKQFQMSGMKPEQIKLTTPYAKLVAANKAPF